MSKPRVHIVGAGIVGLCSAYYLHEAGFAVTLLDASDGQDGTSHGNAGMIVPSHIVPMAAPGVITQGLKWMLDSKSPFYVKPRLDLDLIRWTYQFYRSATHAHVARSIPTLYDFNMLSKRLYAQLAQDGHFDFDFEERGLLMLYKTEHGEREEAQLAKQAQAAGMQVDVLDRDGVNALEPEVEIDARGGIFFPGDAHLYPNRFMARMRGHLMEQGVEFCSGAHVQDIVVEGSRVKALCLRSGERHEVEQVVFATGSWTAKLLRQLGMRMLLQDGKGYSVTLESPARRPRIPTILSEAKVAVTPMGSDLRIGGTLEISGLSERINRQRVEGILESIPRYYRGIDLAPQEELQVWRGFRPCTPDGLPYIGRSDRYANLFVGTGHGMMGLSLGPATGKLIAQAVSEQATELPLEPFAIERFS